MNRLYKLSGLLSLTLPLAALVGSSSTASAQQQVEAVQSAPASARPPKAVTLTKAQIQRLMKERQAQYRRNDAAQKRREAKVLSKVTASGRVLDTTGKPAANVAVNIHWTTPQNQEKFLSLTTDAEGRFSQKLEIKSRSRTLHLSAVVPGKSIAWKQLTLTDKPLAAVDLRLQSGTTLSGRLLDADGSPLANQTISLRSIAGINVNFGDEPNSFAMQQMVMMQSDSNTRLLPVKLTAKLFRTQTDAEGHYTFHGVPLKCIVQLAPEPSRSLAQGSLQPISIGGKPQNAGTRVLVRTGGAKVHVIDPVSGKPVVNTQVSLSPSDFNVTQFQMNGEFQREFNPTSKTDAKGVATFSRLRPGGYYAYLDGKFEKFDVEEGKNSTPVTLTMRQEPLKGRILDRNGKPVVGVQVKMNPIMKANDDIARVSPFVRFGEFGWENRSAATTDAQGRFQLPRTAWTGEQLTIRASQGNACALWEGNPAKINGELTLKMEPDALITVTGRLIDPQRRALKTGQFQSIHWTAAPRSFWVSNARTAKIDADGHFKIEGMERGESFSLITGTRSNGFVMMDGNGMRPNKTKIVPFESPRFKTQLAGQQQDMGDVMVHPLDDPDELDDVYGFGEGQSIAKFPGILPAPSQDAVKEAKQALAQYRRLLRTGDIKQAYALTSRLTPGWSADYKTFLQRAILRDGREDFAPNLEKSVAMRYVPRAAAASLVSSNRGMFSFGITPDFSPVVTELNRSGEWVFLMEVQHGAAVTTGILRKEEGQWRVVNINPASFTGGDPLQMNNFGSVSQPDGADYGKPLPASKSDTIAAARKTAELYLQEWAAGRSSALRPLTSAFSPFAMAQPEEFAHAFGRRADEGICPLTSDEKPVLEPLADVSLWEQQWLTNLTTMAQVQNRMQIMRRSSQIAQQNNTDGNFPTDYAKRADIALFRYSAQGREYLISLVRSKNKWSVLEPAFIRTEAKPQDIALR